MHARVTGAALVGAALLTACGGAVPSNLGVNVEAGGRLAPCPSSDNCVSSDATTEMHRVEPFRLNGSPQEIWPQVRAVVEAMSRTKIVTSDDAYLHAECTSRVFRFVDDLELHLRPDDGIIAVRSASRIGRGDLGVNRKRVEALRQRLAASGLLRE